VTCGVSPSPLSPNDTVNPNCGIPVVKPVGPEDPTPASPRSELVGTFDAGGLQSISNVQITNGTVAIGNQSAPQGSDYDYLRFVPGQTGPLPINATRTQDAEQAGSPMYWSFDATDASGNTVHCHGVRTGPPVAGDDAYQTSYGTPLSVPAPGVLANDTSPDGVPLTAGAATDPPHGTVRVDPNGSFVYVPDPLFSGTDTFTYTANDGYGSATALVTITVAAPPPLVEGRCDKVTVSPFKKKIVNGHGCSLL